MELNNEINPDRKARRQHLQVRKERVEDLEKLKKKSKDNPALIFIMIVLILATILWAIFLYNLIF